MLSVTPFAHSAIAYLNDFRTLIESKGLTESNLLDSLQQNHQELYQLLRDLRLCFDFSTFQDLKRNILDRFHITSNTDDSLQLIDETIEFLYSVCKTEWPCNEEPSNPSILGEGIYGVVDYDSFRQHLEPNDLYRLLFLFDSQIVTVNNCNSISTPPIDGTYTAIVQVFGELTFLKLRQFGTDFGLLSNNTVHIETKNSLIDAHNADNTISTETTAVTTVQIGQHVTISAILDHIV